jgi:hypothetical protein
MKIRDIEIKVQTNADEEIEKVKELVSLLERANELIQSLNNIKITNLEEVEKENTITVISGNERMGQCEILNKLKAEQRILELFETEEIEKIDITYKTRESACEKPTLNN